MLIISHKTMSTLPDNRLFFEAQATESLASAREVLPELMKTLAPRSVVDVGCGMEHRCPSFLLSGSPTL